MFIILKNVQVYAMFAAKKFKRIVSVINLIFLMFLVIVFYKLSLSKSDSSKNHLESRLTPYKNKPNLPYNMKYILKYSPIDRSPFMYIPEGHEIFTRRNCSMTNCYFASNRSILNSIIEFDAILIYGPPAVRSNPYYYLPKERTPNQSYIFVNTESADNHCVPDNRYNNIFNFTWTYKLNSDISYGYMNIRNEKYEVIGPKENMTWISIDDMKPVKQTIIEKLKHKKIAAAWFVSNCNTYGKREIKALLIYEELAKYNMTVDIFGSCAVKRCPRNYMPYCMKLLQKDYYFYFAFENSISDDYVTEKLLYPLNNYAVPIVFGGANYTRFMPDGIYLNAREVTAEKLVKKMVELISDKNKYYNFFKWHNHYSYQYPEKISDIDSFCKFCEFINKVDPNGNVVIDDFYEWWNPHVKPVKIDAIEFLKIETRMRNYFHRIKSNKN